MNTTYTLIALISVILLWSLWGYFSSRVENTSYTVLEKNSNYEVRNYPEHIVAQTTVKGEYREALNQGFRIIAGYIFGGNTKKESIAMTAPVVEKVSEPIAMTAPVRATVEGELHTVSFAMPKSYSLESLPTPDDSRVEIVTMPAKKMAVKRFGFYTSDKRVQAKKDELLKALEKNNVTALGQVQYAGYNAPFTPPWLLRNEVMVEIN